MPTKNRSKLSKRSGSRYTSAHGRLILERLDDRILPSGFRSFDFTPPAPINPGDHNIHTQSFQTIDNPDGDYLNSTTKIEIDPTLDDYTAIDSVSDGSLTVTFAAGGEVRTVPTSWLSWSSPPFSENSSPRLVFTQPGSLLFDSPVTTFGVEIEPNEIAIHTVVVHFQDADGSDIGTISRDVRGDRGARLFALRVDPSNGDPPIASVYIETDPAAMGFGVAEVRYDMSGLGGAPHGHSGQFSEQFHLLLANALLHFPAPMAAQDSLPVSVKGTVEVPFSGVRNFIPEAESPATASNRFLGFHAVNAGEQPTDWSQFSDLDLLTIQW